MSVFGKIKEEHQGILMMLNILEKVLERFSKGEKVSQEDVKFLLEYGEEFIEKVHHKKEEIILYPALEDNDDPKDLEVIEIDLAEHELSKKYIKGLDEAVKRYFAGDKEILPELIQCGRSYIDLTREHAKREDEIVFPLLEKKISPKEEEIEIEIEKIGMGKEDQVKDMLEKLRKEYL